MYIYPEFFVGSIIAFIILLFIYLFAIYILERTNPDREFDLEFRFPIRSFFEIVSKKKEAPKKETPKSEKEFREYWFKHNSWDPSAFDPSEVRRNVNLIIERFKEKYDKNTTQE